MRPIPKKLREELANDPYYKKCARLNNECSGRIEWHHAWIYANRQVNERWAIMPACYEHHRGKYKNDEIFHYLSLQRATDEELSKYPRKDWKQIKKYLSTKYGTKRH